MPIRQAQSENSRDALDYRPIRQMIIDLMQNESFHLIEKLGEVICMNILKDKRIMKVELIIRKTGSFDRLRARHLHHERKQINEKPGSLRALFYDLM